MNESSDRSRNEAARFLISTLCKTRGKESLKNILSQKYDCLLQLGIQSIEQLRKFCLAYPQCFILHDPNGIENVSSDYLEVEVTTDVRICSKHVKMGSSCSGNSNCGGLHICKFFILSGRCGFNFCYFGHQLRTDHNSSLLKDHLMDHLRLKELSSLLRRRGARTEQTRPIICRFYNSKLGCTKDIRCGALHICRPFIFDRCNFGEACFRNHDLLDRTVTSILDQYGVDVDDLAELLLDSEQQTYTPAFPRLSSPCFDSPGHCYKGRKDSLGGARCIDWKDDKTAQARKVACNSRKPNYQENNNFRPGQAKKQKLDPTFKKDNKSSCAGNSESVVKTQNAGEVNSLKRKGNINIDKHNEKKNTFDRKRKIFTSSEDLLKHMKHRCKPLAKHKNESRTSKLSVSDGFLRSEEELPKSSKERKTIVQPPKQVFITKDIKSKKSLSASENVVTRVVPQEQASSNLWPHEKADSNVRKKSRPEAIKATDDSKISNVREMSRPAAIKATDDSKISNVREMPRLEAIKATEDKKISNVREMSQPGAIKATEDKKISNVREMSRPGAIKATEDKKISNVREMSQPGAIKATEDKKISNVREMSQPGAIKATEDKKISNVREMSQPGAIKATEDKKISNEREMSQPGAIKATEDKKISNVREMSQPGAIKATEDKKISNVREMSRPGAIKATEDKKITNVREMSQPGAIKATEDKKISNVREMSRPGAIKATEDKKISNVREMSRPGAIKATEDKKISNVREMSRPGAMKATEDKKISNVREMSQPGAIKATDDKKISERYVEHSQTSAVLDKSGQTLQDETYPGAGVDEMLSSSQADNLQNIIANLISNVQKLHANKSRAVHPERHLVSYLSQLALPEKVKKETTRLGIQNNVEETERVEIEVISEEKQNTQGDRVKTAKSEEKALPEKVKKEPTSLGTQNNVEETESVEIEGISENKQNTQGDRVKTAKSEEKALPEKLKKETTSLGIQNNVEETERVEIEVISEEKQNAESDRVKTAKSEEKALPEKVKKETTCLGIQNNVEETERVEIEVISEEKQNAESDMVKTAKSEEKGYLPEGELFDSGSEKVENHSIVSEANNTVVEKVSSDSNDLSTTASCSNILKAQESYSLRTVKTEEFTLTLSESIHAFPIQVEDSKKANSVAQSETKEVRRWSGKCHHPESGENRSDDSRSRRQQANEDENNIGTSYEVVNSPEEDLELIDSSEDEFCEALLTAKAGSDDANRVNIKVINDDNGDKNHKRDSTLSGSHNTATAVDKSENDQQSFSSKVTSVNQKEESLLTDVGVGSIKCGHTDLETLRSERESCGQKGSRTSYEVVDSPEEDLELIDSSEDEFCDALPTAKAGSEAANRVNIKVINDDNGDKNHKRDSTLSGSHNTATAVDKSEDDQHNFSCKVTSVNRKEELLLTDVDVGSTKSGHTNLQVLSSERESCVQQSSNTEPKKSLCPRRPALESGKKSEHDKAVSSSYKSSSQLKEQAAQLPNEKHSQPEDSRSPWDNRHSHSTKNSEPSSHLLSPARNQSSPSSTNRNAQDEKDTNRNVMDEKDINRNVKDEKDINRNVKDEKDTNINMKDEKDTNRNVKDEKDTNRNAKDEMDTNRNVKGEKDTNRNMKDEKDTNRNMKDEKDTNINMKDEKDTNRNMKDEKDTNRNMKDEKNTNRNMKDEKDTNRNVKDEKDTNRNVKDEKNTNRNVKDEKDTNRNVKDEKDTKRNVKDEKDTNRNVKDEKDTNRNVKDEKDTNRNVKDEKDTNRNVKDEKDTNRNVKSEKDTNRNLKGERESNEKRLDKNGRDSWTQHRSRYHEKRALYDGLLGKRNNENRNYVDNFQGEDLPESQFYDLGFEQNYHRQEIGQGSHSEVPVQHTSDKPWTAQGISWDTKKTSKKFANYEQWKKAQCENSKNSTELEEVMKFRSCLVEEEKFGCQLSASQDHFVPNRREKFSGNGSRSFSSFCVEEYDRFAEKSQHKIEDVRDHFANPQGYHSEEEFGVETSDCNYNPNRSFRYENNDADYCSGFSEQRDELEGSFRHGHQRNSEFDVADCSSLLFREKMNGMYGLLDRAKHCNRMFPRDSPENAKFFCEPSQCQPELEESRNQYSEQSRFRHFRDFSPRKRRGDLQHLNHPELSKKQRVSSYRDHHIPEGHRRSSNGSDYSHRGRSWDRINDEERESSFLQGDPSQDLRNKDVRGIEKHRFRRDFSGTPGFRGRNVGSSSRNEYADPHSIYQELDRLSYEDLRSDQVGYDETGYNKDVEYSEYHNTRKDYTREFDEFRETNCSDWSQNCSGMFPETRHAHRGKFFRADLRNVLKTQVQRKTLLKAKTEHLRIRVSCENDRQSERDKYVDESEREVLIV